MRLHIPAFLNYDCQACGECCRDYEIAMSEETRRQLGRTDWRKLSGEPELQNPFEPSRGQWVGGPYRFKLRRDGACIFLCKDKKCLIHGQLGFEAKALACKLFPLTFAHTPTGVYVGCRFNCRAVAEALGEPLERHRQDIGKLCDEYHFSGYMASFPETVRFGGRQKLTWGDYLKTERAMVNLVLCPHVPLGRRVVALWRLADMMRQARLEKVAGAKYGEFVEVLSEGLLAEAADQTLPERRPNFVTRRLFQQFLFFLHRRRGQGAQSLPWGRRLGRRLQGLWASLKFSFNVGRVQLFHDGPAVRLRDVENVALPELDEQMAGVLERFLAGKLFGKQIFGPLFFGYGFLRGLTALLCAYSAILWYARASALSRGAHGVEPRDVVRAVQHVDFSFGYSPVPLLWTEKLRLVLLGNERTPERLVAWYSRTRPACGGR